MSKVGNIIRLYLKGRATTCVKFHYMKYNVIILYFERRTLVKHVEEKIR